MKAASSKRPGKDERERWILLGLVELYLKTGKPVGSHTLQENGFDSLSSATLRNYFAKLEEGNYLKQQHSSGGRIPTNLAYKVYAESVLDKKNISISEQEILKSLLEIETKQIYSYLQKCVETISDISQGASFLSLPRFDQDFVLDVKLVGIDNSRIVCVFITDFGNISTEILYIQNKLNSFELKRFEQFFRWKITNLDKPDLTKTEESLALQIYNEAMLRRIVNDSHFSSSDLLKTGFSKMLHYPDFNDASSLANGLALFENDIALRQLLADCLKNQKLSFWIGEDLSSYSPNMSACAVFCIPYKIHQNLVGAIGLLCPSRIHYEKIFGLLEEISFIISTSLTKSLYKFKITYRMPQTHQIGFKNYALPLLHETQEP